MTQAKNGHPISSAHRSNHLGLRSLMVIGSVFTGIHFERYIASSGRKKRETRVRLVSSVASSTPPHTSGMKYAVWWYYSAGPRSCLLIHFFTSPSDCISFLNISLHCKSGKSTGIPGEPPLCDRRCISLVSRKKENSPICHYLQPHQLC